MTMSSTKHAKEGARNVGLLDDAAKQPIYGAFSLQTRHNVS